MDGNNGRQLVSLSIVTAEKRQTVFPPMIDKLYLVNKGQLMVYFTHRPPVSIWGEDALALYIYLHSPTQSCYTEVVRRIVADLEKTAA